jgi:hypothetical protein
MQVRRARSFSIACIPAPHISNSSRRTSKHSKHSKQSALLLPRASLSQSCPSATQAGFRSRCAATKTAASRASSRIICAATHQSSRCTHSCYPATFELAQASRPQASSIFFARSSVALPAASTRSQSLAGSLSRRITHPALIQPTGLSKQQHFIAQGCTQPFSASAIIGTNQTACTKRARVCSTPSKVQVLLRCSPRSPRSATRLLCCCCCCRFCCCCALSRVSSLH